MWSLCAGGAREPAATPILWLPDTGSHPLRQLLWLWLHSGNCRSSSWCYYLGRRHEVNGPSFVPFLEVWVTQKWGARCNHEFWLTNVTWNLGHMVNRCCRTQISCQNWPLRSFRGCVGIGHIGGMGYRKVGSGRVNGRASEKFVRSLSGRSRARIPMDSLNFFSAFLTFSCILEPFSLNNYKWKILSTEVI